MSNEKYSKAYFEQRIHELQEGIRAKIPSKDELLKENNNDVLIPLIQALENAQSTLASTKEVRSALQNEQHKHPEDDGWKDPKLVDPAGEAQTKAETTVASLEETITKTCCYIVKCSGLLDSEARQDDDDKTPAGILSQIERDLLECTILIQATPKKLASWVAQDNKTNTKMLDAFLGDALRMAAFLEAGGPSHGNYGVALTICKSLLRICKQIFRFHNPTEHVKLIERLALAVALEHATPIAIFKQKDQFVDPIERFLYYAKFVSKRSMASTDNNDKDTLDKSFFNLSTWELRKVIDANATSEDLDWGRAFLRNYRPDQIYTSDEKWRYVMSVRTDVGYRHPDHDFETYQELISAGGECGPRAFFGRFISKAWGLPTWGVRQPGHAAMTRWTKSGGWVVCLGAGWPFSWWDDDRYGSSTHTRHGPDFFEETKARGNAGKGGNDDIRNQYYKNVVLLECLAECMNETVEEDFVADKFWRSLALAQRKQLANQQEQQQRSSNHFSLLAGAATCIDEESWNKAFQENTHVTSALQQEKESSDLSDLYARLFQTEVMEKRTRLETEVMVEEIHLPDESTSATDKNILPPFPSKIQASLVCYNKPFLIHSDGTIVIPATSFVSPEKPSKNVLVMKSFDGNGDQLHLEHSGSVEYQLSSWLANTGSSCYELSAKVVNVHRNQKPLLVTMKSNNPGVRSIENGYELVDINAPDGLQELQVPYTMGYWQKTESIRVNLVPGARLGFTREDPCWGLSVKEFYLEPIKRTRVPTTTAAN